MNKLSYKITEDSQDGLEVMLYIDEKPLTDYNIWNPRSHDTSDYRGVTLFMIAYENNTFPKISSEFDFIKKPVGTGVDFIDYEWNDNIRIFGVCSCGMAYCGNIYGRITEKDNSVLFDNFGADAYESNNSLSFEFTKDNYNEVIKEIIVEVEKKDFHPSRK